MRRAVNHLSDEMKWKSGVTEGGSGGEPALLDPLESTEDREGDRAMRVALCIKNRELQVAL